MLRDRSIIIKGFVLPVRTLACRSNLGGGIERSTAVIDACLVHDDHIFLGIEDFLLSPGILPSITAVVVEGGLSLDAVTGSHQDHTVGGTGAIDGCGGRILQDFHRLDVIGVQVVDATVDRHSVHDEERVGIVNGADTTNFDLGTGTRLAGCLSNLYTRYFAFDGIVDSGGAHLI